MRSDNYSKVTVGIAILLCAMLALTTTGCDEGSGDATPQNFSSGNDGDNDDNDADPCDDVECGDDEYCEDGECLAEDTEPCDGVECPDGEVCFEGDCQLEADTGYACADPFDLTGLSDGHQETVTADTTGQPNLLMTDCADESSSDSGDAVFHVTVDEPGFVEFEFTDAGENPMVAEVRQGSCGEADPDATCETLSEGSSVRFLAEEDTDYFIVVQARHDSTTGEFSADVSTEGVLCAPPGHEEGGTYCGEDPDELIACAVTEEEFYECGADCEDGECQGDHCGNAIEVTGSITVEGDMENPAYFNHFDFEPYPGCTDGSENVGPVTSGQDVVFYLPGLVEGQDVEVDVSDSDPSVRADAVIGILNDCDEDNADCVDGVRGHDMIWSVPEDGDYWVVVNLVNPNMDQRFVYSIDIIE